MVAGSWVLARRVSVAGGSSRYELGSKFFSLWSLAPGSPRYGAWLRNAPIFGAVLRRRALPDAPSRIPSRPILFCRAFFDSSGALGARNGCGAKLRRWVRDGVQLRHEGENPSLISSSSITL